MYVKPYTYVHNVVPLSCSWYSERSGQSCQWHHETRGKSQFRLNNHANNLIMFVVLHTDCSYLLFSTRITSRNWYRCSAILTAIMKLSSLAGWGLFTCVIILSLYEIHYVKKFFKYIFETTIKQYQSSWFSDSSHNGLNFIKPCNNSLRVLKKILPFSGSSFLNVNI